MRNALIVLAMALAGGCAADAAAQARKNFVFTPSSRNGVCMVTLPAFRASNSM